jgi:hypothetical protein
MNHVKQHQIQYDWPTASPRGMRPARPAHRRIRHGVSLFIKDALQNFLHPRVIFDDEDMGSCAARCLL